MPIPTRMVAAALVACLVSSNGVIAQQGESSDATATTGGWVAYLDPATGKLIDSPPFGKSTLKMTREELNMFSTDDFGLIERVTPDGGLMIDLQGRFRKGTLARITGDGRIAHQYIGGEIFRSETGQRIRKQARKEQLPQGAEVAGK